MARRSELEARIAGLQRQVDDQQRIIGQIAAQLGIEIQPIAQTGAGPGVRPAGASSLPPAAIEALASGNKILAVKLLREAHHPAMGLKEAKDVVEAYERTGGQGPLTGSGSAWG
ncbi:MAG: hypothetical protein ACTH1Z_07375 [Ancrocorticia sp.]|uniref:hypothetical protein n=1 Tax=Ancrocorticia sp. TaxID=2593684 RepID=UPI003F90741C